MPTTSHPHGECGTPQRIRTNVVAIHLPNASVYHYKVEMIGRRRDGGEQKLTCRYRFDWQNVQRTCIVRDAFSIFLSEYEVQFFSQPRNFFLYDCLDNVYTVKKLDMTTEYETLHLNSEQIADAEVLQAYSAVNMKISEAECLEIKLGDLQFVKHDSAQWHENELKHCLETILYQKALFKKVDVYSMSPSNWIVSNHLDLGYTENQFPLIVEGKRTCLGAHCYVRAMLGSDETPHMSLTVDWNLALSQAPMNLVTKALLVCEKECMENLIDRDILRLSIQFRGLQVYTMHTTRMHYFVIDHVVPAKDVKEFVIGGDQSQNGTEQITVAQYFLLKYNIELRYPGQVYVAERTRQLDSFNYYPLELCFVPVQEVRPSMETRLQKKYVERLVTAVHPIERLKRIQVLRDNLGLTNENGFLHGCGVTVGDEALEVTGRILEPPQIGLANNIYPISHDGSWKPEPGYSQFVLPVHLRNWAVCAALVRSSRENEMLGDDHSKLYEFVKKLIRECKQYGMEVDDPYKCTLDEFCERKYKSKKDQLKNCIRKLKEEGYNFILFLTSSELDGLHEWMKVFERDNFVVTQDVRLDTVCSIMRSSGKRSGRKDHKETTGSTMFSLISKINIKCGGLNYELVPNGLNSKQFVRRLLFIGIYTEKVKPAADSPVMIGYSANWNSGEFEFVGDFRIVPAEESEYDVLDVINRCCRKFCLGHECEPLSIIIYRSHISTRAYAKVVDDTKEYMASVGFGNIPLTYVIVDGQHGIRMARKEATSKDAVVMQNLIPGTVIDTELVHPLQREFFLNSHLGSMGTSCIPRYSLIMDKYRMPGENEEQDHHDKWNDDEIESITFALTFASQTTCRPTRVPAPLFIAESYVERGRKLLRLNESNVKSNGFYITDKIFQYLCYEGTPFENIRINA